MVANVRIVCRQTHQIVHQTEDDQQTGYRCQNEHHLRFLNAVLAERLHLVLLAHFHVLLARVRRKHEAELCQIDARAVRLDADGGAQVPEHRVHERDHDEEAQHQDPDDVQDVGDAHELSKRAQHE